MKYIKPLLLALFGIFLLTGSYAYAKKCKKCQEDLEKNKTRYYTAGIACRDFGVPIKYIDGEPYATYKCCYGHIYLVNLNE